MTETASGVGLQFRLDKAISGNTLDAHRVIHLAASRGLQAEADERIKESYFAEGRPISDRESLIELAARSGSTRTRPRDARERPLHRRGARGRADGCRVRHQRRAVLRLRPPARRLRRTAAGGAARRVAGGGRRGSGASSVSPVPRERRRSRVPPCDPPRPGRAQRTSGPLREGQARRAERPIVSPVSTNIDSMPPRRKYVGARRTFRHGRAGSRTTRPCAATSASTTRASRDPARYWRMPTCSGSCQYVRFSCSSSPSGCSSTDAWISGASRCSVSYPRGSSTRMPR